MSVSSIGSGSGPFSVPTFHGTFAVKKAGMPNSSGADSSKLFCIGSGFAFAVQYIHPGWETHRYVIFKGTHAITCHRIQYNSIQCMSQALLDADPTTLPEDSFEQKSRVFSADRHPSNLGAHMVLMMQRVISWKGLGFNCEAHINFKAHTESGSYMKWA